jgi:hypothetical protein
MNKDTDNSRDLLNDAIRDVSGESATARRATSAQPSAKPGNDLRKVLNELSGVASNANSAPAASQAAKRLGDVVQEIHVEGAATSPALSHHWRRLGLRTLAVILLLVAAAFWWSTSPPPGPDSTLQSLTQAVEQYRSGHNGELPKELATLEAFPKNAVEWPLRYWKARDAAGRSEIIWVPQNSGHYRILVRQGSEVWTVTDRDSKPRLAMKGNP